MDRFVNLHVHDEYSMLDGAAKISPLVGRAVELGQSALGQTNHGNMFGAFEFYQECTNQGVKPIIGMEAYFAPEGRAVRERVVWGQIDEDGKSKNAPGAYTHMCLWAQDATGLQNLYRLHARSFAEGSYYKPRIDMEMLAEHSAGLIASTGCAGGVVATALRLGQPDRAMAHAGELHDIFSDRLYVELMSHGMPWEAELVRQQIDLATRMALPLLATNDSHYVNPGDASTHDALLCLQTNARISDQSRFRFGGSGYYLKSRSEMDALELPRAALDNTLVVAERVSGYGDFFGHKLRMPEAILPDGWTAEEALQVQSADGLLRRLGLPLEGDYLDRLNYELDVIIKMGYADYFLVLADVVTRAKAKGIRVGPGRGSAGGSLVAYALSITDLDPVHHGLLFERFLNPSRASLPDIDVDFDDTRRDEVIADILATYGDRAARVLTLGTIKAKRAITDSARVLSRTYATGQRLLGGLPPDRFGRTASLGDGTWNDPSAEDAEVLELAGGLEGLIRNTGIHASALIISPEPLADILPVWTKDGALVTGFDQGPVGELGLVKLDLLGLSNLSVIERTLALLPGVRLPETYDDPKTYALLASGNTMGVFQLDSSLARGLLRKIKPATLGDVAATIALGRPGPMGAGTPDQYAKRKNG